MDKKIEKILNDLYILDGNLKNHDREARKIVEELLYSKPDAEVNEEFIGQLHLKLVKRMEYMKEERTNHARTAGNLSFFGGLAYSLMGAAAVLLVVVGAAYYFNFNQGKNTPDEIAIDLHPKIAKLGDGAFGHLTLDQSRLNSTPAAQGLGGGGMGIVKIPTPEAINFRYIYKGGDIDMLDKATVYKRIKEIPLENNITGAFSSLNLGLIDLGKFSNARIGNLNLTENRDFGYDVSLDFREGMVSIYAGSRWPDPGAGCQDKDCYEKIMLKESDIPADTELVLIANRFLDDYKIDRSVYGDPIVIKDYGWSPMPLVDGTKVYVPETIPVVYPQKINGETVYDDAGNMTGMTVDVNIRYKKAYSARNIFSQKYESSDYEAEKDKGKIISFAENGGMYGNYMALEATKTVDIELGTPKVELITIWNYDPVKRMSDNLYVPAYVFPIVKMPGDQYFYRKNVIVPIPKDILEKFNRSPDTIPGSLMNK